jgi:hypothetical protein
VEKKTVSITRSSKKSISNLYWYQTVDLCAYDEETEEYIISQSIQKHPPIPKSPLIMQKKLRKGEGKKEKKKKERIGRGVYKFQSSLRHPHPPGTFAGSLFMPDASQMEMTTSRTALTCSTVAPPLRAPLRWPFSSKFAYREGQLCDYP